VDDGSTLTYYNFTIEYVHFEGAGGVGSSLPPSMSTSIPEPPPTSTLHCLATTSAAMMSSPPPPQPVPPCTPAATAIPLGTSTPAPAHDEECIDACYDGEPLQYRMMEDLLGDQPVQGLVPHDLDGQLHLACDDGEPRSFTKAEKDAAWHAVMKAEMDAVEKNHTWELADLPRGHHTITLKWVFKLNRDEVGAIIKHKACLVARGFL
jgi:hypothetical protein